MKSYFSTLNKNFIEIVYGIKPTECTEYLVETYLDNLHLDFLKQYNFIPKDSVTCINSMNLYKIV